MTVLHLRAVAAAREELRVRAVVTPRRAVEYTDRYTGVSEVIRPGRHYFAADHEAVRRNPQAFKRAVDPMSPAGREERRLLRELADVKRQQRELAATGRADTMTRSRARPRTGTRDRVRPWRLSATTRAKNWRLT